MSRFKTFEYIVLGSLMGMSVTPALWAQGSVPSNGQTEGVQSNNLADNPQGSVNAQPGNSVYPNNYSFNGANQTPWFNNPGIQRELQISNQQNQQLNNAYNQAWTQYNQNLNGIDSGLPESTRSQHQFDHYNTFNRQFTRSTNGVFNNLDTQQRYNQLYLQYRGFSAFNDPAVSQELNLTPGQRQLFQQYDRDWNRNMRTWSRQYASDPNGVTRQYNSAQDDYRQQMGTALTPQQQQTWNRMTGRSYDWTPGNYFQTAPRVEDNTSRFDNTSENP